MLMIFFHHQKRHFSELVHLVCLHFSISHFLVVIFFGCLYPKLQFLKVLTSWANVHDHQNISMCVLAKKCCLLEWNYLVVIENSPILFKFGTCYITLSVFTKYLDFKSHLQSIQGKIYSSLKIYLEKSNTYQVEVLSDLQNIEIDHDPWVLKAEFATFLNCNFHKKVFQEDVQS